jgi:hypothetical protein
MVPCLLLPFPFIEPPTNFPIAGVNSFISSPKISIKSSSLIVSFVNLVMTCSRLPVFT